MKQKLGRLKGSAAKLFNDFVDYDKVQRRLRSIVDFFCTNNTKEHLLPLLDRQRHFGNTTEKTAPGSAKRNTAIKMCYQDHSPQFKTRTELNRTRLARPWL